MSGPDPRAAAVELLAATAGLPPGECRMVLERLLVEVPQSALCAGLAAVATAAVAEAAEARGKSFLQVLQRIAVVRDPQ